MQIQSTLLTAAALATAVSAEYVPGEHPHWPHHRNETDGGMVITVTRVHDYVRTWCPEPTTLCYNNRTYTMPEPTTFILTDCPCTQTYTTWCNDDACKGTGYISTPVGTGSPDDEGGATATDEAGQPEETGAGESGAAAGAAGEGSGAGSSGSGGEATGSGSSGSGGEATGSGGETGSSGSSPGGSSSGGSGTSGSGTSGSGTSGSGTGESGSGQGNAPGSGNPSTVVVSGAERFLAGSIAMAVGGVVAVLAL